MMDTVLAFGTYVGWMLPFAAYGAAHERWVKGHPDGSRGLMPWLALLVGLAAYALVVWASLERDYLPPCGIDRSGAPAC